MSRLIFAVFGLLFCQIINAQICGTPQQPLLDRIESDKHPTWHVPRGQLRYIPITFHLVADSDGDGRVQEENVFLQLESLNDRFEDQQAIFYIDRLNYFNNTAVYETPSSSAATVQMRLRKDNNSMNIFITNSAEHGSEGPGITLAYYDPQEDWIVSRRNEINAVTTTLSHEIGHFFTLPHPFLGWECMPYTDEDYGNPVTANFTLPCDGGGGSAPIELQNGSNCDFTGDRICDTPPDYNIGYLHQPNSCAPNTSVKDKNGEVITPITNNYMSYYRNCGSYVFTPTQKNIMNNNFFAPQRLYIRTGYVPNQDSVEAPVTYISPINAETTPTYTDILLDWEDTPGATNYMVLVDRFPMFTNNPQKYFVEESQLIIPELPENVLFYWKVWPYNESETGAGYSPTQSFRVGMGTGINEISEINDYFLSPNPVEGKNQTWLTLTSNKDFDAELRITDAAGHVFSQSNLTVPAGTSQHIMETNDLPAGIYFIMMHSQSGVLVERLLIIN